MVLGNVKVRTKFMVLIGGVILASCGFGLFTSRIVDRVKVGGPLYGHIVMGKDLIADILPPPEYILESYLTAMQLVGEKSERERGVLEGKIAQLRKDFEDRHAYWSKELPAGEMRDSLLIKAADPARKFFDLAATKMLPLLEAGKSEEASALLNGEMRESYRLHRAAIDEVVQLASEFAKTTEQGSTEELSSSLTMLSASALGAVLSLVGLCALIARSVTKPLNQLEVRMRDIAEGEGDLTKRVGVMNRDEIGMVAESFNVFVGKIERLVEEVKAGAKEIDAGGVQIASSSQSLAQGASEQASSLQQISASLEEISGQTQQSAENARQASTLADDNKKAADRGQHEMAEMSKAVSEIKQSSGEISKIIRVIDEIAFQTNLLALNAAVEAARAGEAGKGFAVVAEEVRNLAHRSAEAAKSTSVMIEDSVKRSERGVQIAVRVGGALEEIASCTGKVSALLAEIASASNEQSVGISQINQGVSQLDQVTQQNAGNSQELASSAEEMSSQVAQLSGLVDHFKVGSRAQPTA